jgi:hypothetical protein
MTPCLFDPGITIIIMGTITHHGITKQEFIHGFRCMQGGLSMIPSMPINDGTIGMITNGKIIWKPDFVNVENSKDFNRLRALVTVQGMRS